MNAIGFNPLRWDCSARGCYNLAHRPRIEVFADIWPGRISMGDIDAVVEINGNLLWLEWKTVEKDIPTGQRIMFSRVTASGKFMVLICCGNPQTMEVSSCAAFIRGKRWPSDRRGWITADLSWVRRQMERWRDKSLSLPRIG